MIELKRTDASHPHFIELVGRLDADLAQRDGSAHSFYAPFNTLTSIRHVVVAYEAGVPVGCGAIRILEPGVMEVKRMYTPPEHRKKGIAAKVLSALEEWAAALSCRKCVLETGKKQPEAIRLYQKHGYSIIPNYGQYQGVENSVCFEKRLNNETKAKRLF